LLYFCSFRSAFFLLLFQSSGAPPYPHSFPTRRSSDLLRCAPAASCSRCAAYSRSRPQRRWNRVLRDFCSPFCSSPAGSDARTHRSEEHTSELQSRFDLVCRLLLEKKKKKYLMSCV